MKPYFILIFVLLLKLNPCYSQWTQTNGPYGNTNILAIIPDDSLILVETNCGYFSKKKINDSWALNSTASFSGYTKIGDSLFIGGNEIKLIDLTHPDNPAINIDSFPISLTTLSHSDSCLYGGNATMGFFKSNNSGYTWSFASNGLPYDSIWNPWMNIYIHQYNVLCIGVTSNYIFCGTKKGVYRNTGNLGTWVAVNSGLPTSNVTLIESYSDTLFAAIDNVLYRSSDDGNSWSLLFTSPSNITSFLKTNSIYYLGTINNGIFLSSDKATSWNTYNTGLTDSRVTTISYYDSILICGTYSKGLFYYLNNNWTNNNNQGMICSYISCLTNTDSFIIASEWYDVFISDFNNNWKVITPTCNHDFWASVCSLHDTIVLSVEHDTVNWPYDIPYILFSANKGITWDSLISQPPFAGDDPYGIYCHNSNIYAHENEIMYYTDNLGVSWKPISLPPQYCNYFYGFAVFNSTPFASACGNAQLLKLNTNSNWILSNNGLPTDRETNAISFCDSALFTYVSEHGMYVSRDSGNTWSYASNGLITSQGIRDFTSYHSNLFVTTENGVFVTGDFGMNWASINSGLKTLNTSSIKILNDTLYVGTYGNGIWKQAISNIALGTQDNQLSNNGIKIFPNPASDYIQILPISYRSTSIKIYDVLGNILLSENWYSKNKIDTSLLENGIYIVSVKLDNETLTSKLIINR